MPAGVAVVQRQWAAILDHLGKPVHYRDAPAGGTERAARMIANLL